MASVSFVCDGYEVRGKYLLSTNLCNWKTNNAIAPLIAGYSGSQFFRLSAGATLVFMHDSLPRYFQVVTTNAVASRLYFYEDHELEELARKAGFSESHFERPDFEPLARAAGIPEEHLELFKGRGGGQLLIARKE